MFVHVCVCVTTKCSAHDKCHPETRTFALEWCCFKGGSKNHPCKMPITHRICALWLKGSLSMDSLNLGSNWLLDKKSRNVVEWDTFVLEIVTACNRKKRFDKSAAQRFFLLQSSELWGNKNGLSAQLELQLISFETKSVPYFPSYSL